MKSVDVVIGSNYGDEYKGGTTDYLASKYDPQATAVVRFNGGHQAGHTVVCPDGRRHVFHALGSGSFHGAATVLASRFVINPLLFFKELDELEKLDVLPRVFVSTEAIVTTPFDVAINQVVEFVRGIDGGRHGSCGIGFGETIQRSETPAFRIIAGDMSTAGLRRVLGRIYEEYVPFRLEQLLTAEQREIALASDLWPFHGPNDVEEIVENFILTCNGFNNYVQYKDDHNLMEFADHYIFEGAQGLALDQIRGDFPYVTRSNTGLTNVMPLLDRMDKGVVPNIHYVTRPYFTRHGAGPLHNELDSLPYPGVIDTTNVKNAWQAHLRFAYFDFDAFTKRVSEDYRQARWVRKAMTTAVVSCCNQVAGRVKFYRNREPDEASVNEFVHMVAYSLRTDKQLISFGPTRTNMIL